MFLFKLVTSEITMFVYRPKTLKNKPKQKIKPTNKKIPTENKNNRYIQENNIILTFAFRKFA